MPDVSKEIQRGLAHSGKPTNGEAMKLRLLYYQDDTLGALNGPSPLCPGVSWFGITSKTSYRLGATSSQPNKILSSQ